MPDKILCLPQILRILEPIVAYYAVDLCFLKNFIFKKLKVLLDLREGYFLLRKFCKELKDHDIQVELVKHLTSIPLEYYQQANACLLSQCILLNFQLKDYPAEYCKYDTISLKDYYKKFYYLEDSDLNDPILVTVKEEEKVGRRKNINDYFDNKTITKINKVYDKVFTIDKDNNAVCLLLEFILDNIVSLDFSSYEYPSQLINSAITYGGLMFQKFLLKKVNKSNYSFLTLLLETKNRGVSIMNNCIVQLSSENLKSLKKIFKQILSEIDIEQEKNSNLKYAKNSLREECLDLAYVLQLNSKKILSIELEEPKQSKKIVKSKKANKLKVYKYNKSGNITEKIKIKETEIENQKSINSIKNNPLSEVCPQFFVSSRIQNTNASFANIDLGSASTFYNNPSLHSSYLTDFSNQTVNYNICSPYNISNIASGKNINKINMNLGPEYNMSYNLVIGPNNIMYPYTPINNVLGFNNNNFNNNNYNINPYQPICKNGTYNNNIYMQSINKQVLLNNSNCLNSFGPQQCLDSQSLRNQLKDYK